MKRFIGIDPGKTTGLAIATYNTETNKWSLLFSQFTDYTWLRDLNLNSNDVVIIEDYFVPKDKYFCTAGIEVIGAVKAACVFTGVNYIMQRMHIPSFIQKRYKNELTKLKIPIHARDATSHLIWYLRERYDIENILSDFLEERKK